MHEFTRVLQFALQIHAKCLVSMLDIGSCVEKQLQKHHFPLNQKAFITSTA